MVGLQTVVTRNKILSLVCSLVALYIIYLLKRMCEIGQIAARKMESIKGFQSLTEFGHRINSCRKGMKPNSSAFHVLKLLSIYIV